MGFVEVCRNDLDIPVLVLFVIIVFQDLMILTLKKKFINGTRKLKYLILPIEIENLD
jgi:hypothetical protein